MGINLKDKQIISTWFRLKKKRTSLLS